MPPLQAPKLEREANECLNHTSQYFHTNGFPVLLTSQKNS